MEVKQHLQVTLLCPLHSAIQVIESRTLVRIAMAGAQHDPVAKRNTHSVESHVFDGLKVLLLNKGLTMSVQNV